MMIKGMNKIDPTTRQNILSSLNQCKSVSNKCETCTVGVAYRDHEQLYDQPLIVTSLVRSGISPFKILRLI